MARLLIILLLSLLLSACATQVTRVDNLNHEDETIATPSLKLKMQRLALAPKSGAQAIEKETLEIGDIVLTADDGSLISFAIRLASISPVSHAAIYVGDNIFVEAVAKGVHKATIEDLIEEQTVIAVYRHPELTDEQRERLKSIALDGVGHSYHFVGVALQAPFMVTRRACEIPLMPNLTRQACYGTLAAVQMPFPGGDKSFCSQYVLNVFQEAGVPLTDARAHWVSPRDLMHMRENDVPGFDPHLQLRYVGHLKQAPIALQ